MALALMQANAKRSRESKISERRETEKFSNWTISTSESNCKTKQKKIVPLSSAQ